MNVPPYLEPERNPEWVPVDSVPGVWHFWVVRDPNPEYNHPLCAQTSPWEAAFAGESHINITIDRLNVTCQECLELLHA